MTNHLHNKFIELYKNVNGIELNTFLLENKKLPPTDRLSLTNKRVFYVVKANLDKDEDVYKIGISERGYNSAKGRLIDYVHFYGVSTPKNECLGVKLYLLLANVFNPDVEYRNAAVRRLETKVKRQFKDNRERGDERINVPIQELFTYLESNKYLTDTEPVVRQTPRLAAKEQAASNAVKQILSHSTNRRGVRLFEIEFSKGFRYDTNEKQIPYKRPNQKLPYSEIIQLPRGKTLLDEYIDDHGLRPPTTRQTRSATKADDAESCAMPKIKITTQTTRRTRAGNKTVSVVHTVKTKANGGNIELKPSEDKNKKFDVFQDGKRIASF